MTPELAPSGLMTLVGGLAVVVVVLAWHIRMILVGPYPAARAVSALVVTVPLFLIVFASIYYLMGAADPAQLSEPLTKLDALYFTVTVFVTVGFGDITAVTQAARAVTTVQMMAGLTLVGVIARVVVGAVQVNWQRSAAGPRTESPGRVVDRARGGASGQQLQDRERDHDGQAGPQHHPGGGGGPQQQHQRPQADDAAAQRTQVGGEPAAEPAGAPAGRLLAASA